MIKKIILFVFLIIISVSLFFYYKNTSDLKSNTTIFIVNDKKVTDDDKILHLILFRYIPKNKELKVLFIDDKITIIQKKVKSRSFNENYYLQKENKYLFIKQEIKKIFTNDMTIDNYICVDVEDFKNFLNTLDIEKNNLKELKNNLLFNEDYSIKIIYNIKFIKNIFGKINRFKFLKFLRYVKENKNLIDTDIDSVNVLKMYLSLKNIDNICFIDIPTINKRKRMELNKDFIDKTEKMFFEDDTLPKEQDNIKVKVLNASKKQRMAIKVVDKLRNNGFDVFEWGSYSKIYDYTLILNLTENKQSALKIQNILGCGEILYRFEDKPFEDIRVIIGKDCNISDELDTKKN